MKYICPECGSEIPEDSEFCYTCGRKRDNTIRLDQSGHFVPPEENRCASCGTEMSPDDLFCPSCGELRSKIQMIAFRPQMVKYGWIGIALAIIPGALGFIPGLIGGITILGLGHFYFKKWSRGITYIFLSLVITYVKITTGMSVWTNLVFEIAIVFFYLLQAMEVFVLAFMPPKTAE